MAKKNLLIDGKTVPASTAVEKKLSPGQLTGRGVFETMRAYRGIIFAPEKHLDRLGKGLKVLNIKPPCSPVKMKEYLYALLKSNGLNNARLRLAVWQERSQARMAVVAMAYYPQKLSQYHQGFKAVFAGQRRNESSPEVRIKSIRYGPMILALQQAKAKGQDEAIFLNRKGYLVEGSRTNLFFVRQKTLWTPSLTCGCLEGITRGIVLEICRRLKIPVKQLKTRPDDLLTAQEAFLTNSLIGVMPLTCVQGKLIGTGHPGPVTLRIMKAYNQLVRRAVAAGI